MKKSVLALLFGFFALAFLNLSVAQEATRPEIRVRLQFSGPQQWDPAFLGRAADDFVATNIYNRLLKFEPGGSDVVPDLATSWERSEDGLVYTFNLREGVQFHKGYGELTAEDVKFSFDRIMDPDTGSPYIGLWNNVEEVRAVAPYTVEIEFKEPDATFITAELAYRRGFIVSKDAYEELGDDFAQNPIGSGPFQFVELTTAEEVVVEAHDEYFEGPPEVSGITFVPINEETVARAALEAGEMDLIWTRGNPEVADGLRAHPEISTETVTTTVTRFLGFNPDHEALSNKLVRQALSFAIDRNLIEAATGGLERAAEGPLGPAFGRAVNGDLPGYEYNPERARELLADAGYPDGFQVEFLYSLRSPDSIFADIIVQQWRDIGIDVVRRGMEHRSYTDARRQGDYQITLLGLGRPPEPIVVFEEVFHSKQVPPGSNIGYYSAVDHLIEEAKGTLDDDARRETYYQIQEQIMEDLPVFPLTYSTVVVAWREPIETLVHGINNDFQAYSIEVVE